MQISKYLSILSLQLCICTFIIAVALFSCSNNSSSTSANLHNVEKEFYEFIEHFSSDSNFRKSRIQFPLRLEQYQVIADKDTIVFLESSELQNITFRTSSTAKYSDKWEEQIVIDNDKNKATIECRGIENGIMVNYNFEKIDGIWMLISIDDSST